MNSQQFDSSEPARAQRLTEQETQAVIALWQRERVEEGGLTNKSALPDVAEGLDIGVDDVRRLLDRVRALRAEEEKLLAQDQIEAELEQIRLAEEERQLAEVRRQRAEVQRQRAERRRQSTEAEAWESPQWIAEQTSANGVRATVTTKDGFVTVFAILLIAATVMWLLVSAISPHSGANSSAPQPCYINNNPTSAADCYAISHGNNAPFSNPEYHDDSK